MQWARLLTGLEPLNPILATHLREWQDASIQAYADAIWTLFGNSAAAPSEALACEISKVSRSYSERSSNLSVALSESPVVLTVHHTAPLFHPIALQTLLLAVAGSKPPRSLPVLSTDWVPMDNMFHPRGMLLPHEGKLLSFHLFGKKSRKQMVSHVPSFDETMVKKLQNTLVQTKNKGCLDESVTQQALDCIDRFYLHAAVLNQSSYRKQCSIINQLMWHELFPEIELHHLNISDLILPLMIRSIKDTDSVIHKVLFEEKIRSAVLDVLDGVGGCWDSRKQSGSLFFWQQHSSKMVPLTSMKRNSLCNAQAQFALEPLDVCESLEKGCLIPGLFLTFLQLMFVEGVACIGGMRQIAYNTLIRQGLMRVFAQHCPELIPRIESIPVDRFAAGLNVVNLDSGNPATLLELLNDPTPLRSDWRKGSFKSAVLEASDYLLEFSG